MSSSNVPAVLTALFNLTKTALPAANVIYGEPLQGQPGDFICIGWHRQQAAVQNQQVIGDLGLRSSFEDFDVASEIVAWDGGTDMPAVVTRAYALLDAIDEAVRATPHLGLGPCMLAQRTDSELTPAQTPDGAMAVLSFTVNVRAQR